MTDATKPPASRGAVSEPETARLHVEKADLTRALHLMRHEHGSLWDPTSYCGCSDWADALWQHLEEMEAP